MRELRGKRYYAFSIIVLCSLIWFAFSRSEAENQPTDEQLLTASFQAEPEPLVIAPELDEFGIDQRYFNREAGYFNRRESVYSLLEQRGLERLHIHQIAVELKKYFDPGTIYPSQRYFLYTQTDMDSTSLPVSQMVIEKDEQNYVRVDFSTAELIIIREGSRIVQSKERIVEGIIERSLYHTLVDQKLPYDLLWKMEQVYDWKLDFGRLQKGDRFKLLVEELWIGDRNIGLGDILACEFVHKEEEYKAFRYQRDGRSVYYDENGQSLSKAILRAPLKYTRVSSGFSNNRLHPVLKRRMPHHGVDFAAPTGTPVVSAGDGVVLEARYKGANGNYIRIRHNGSFETAYLHLRNFAKGIKPGTTVKQGQLIGYVGSTGRSTGPHLDYRVFRNGKAVNPFTLELPSNDQLEAEEYERFAVKSLDTYSSRLGLNL